MKNILIVCKKTSFELFEQRIVQSFSSGVIDKSYYDKLYNCHEEHYKNLGLLKDLLQKSNIKFDTVTRDNKWPDLSGFDLVVSFGGDGTILAASHKLEDNSVLLLGVKSSLSSVGHLCSYEPSEFTKLVDDIKNNNLKIKELSRVYAEVSFLSQKEIYCTTPVLNDFLFSNEIPSLTTRYSFQLGTESERQKSSGIWFSTSAGSSAGIHAGGGKIMQEDLGQVQFLIREAYDLKDSNFLQGEFDPKKVNCKIVNYCEHAILAADGQYGVCRLQYGDSFVIKKAHPLKIVI
jgi:NAD+ kinase